MYHLLSQSHCASVTQVGNLWVLIEMISLWELSSAHRRFKSALPLNPSSKQSGFRDNAACLLSFSTLCYHNANAEPRRHHRNEWKWSAMEAASTPGSDQILMPLSQRHVKHLNTVLLLCSAALPHMHDVIAFAPWHCSHVLRWASDSQTLTSEGQKAFVSHHQTTQDRRLQRRAAHHHLGASDEGCACSNWNHSRNVLPGQAHLSDGMFYVGHWLLHFIREPIRLSCFGDSLHRGRA